MSAPLTALILAGGLTFAGAKFIWDAENSVALTWAALIGGLGYWLATQKPAPPSSPDLTPDV